MRTLRTKCVHKFAKTHSRFTKTNAEILQYDFKPILEMQLILQFTSTLFSIYKILFIAIRKIAWLIEILFAELQNGVMNEVNVRFNCMSTAI